MLKILARFHQDSLVRNSFYLMLATAVMAGFGFFFWLINARFFTTANIGIATTLISVMSLIAILSLVGFNATFVRFLPNSDEPNDKMNTGIILVTVAATILSTSFVLLVNKLSPSLAFIAQSPLIAGSFIFFCVMTALNILTDSVFLAARQAKYTLIINIIFSAIKMVLPFAFIGYGALGIFLAAALGQTVGFILSVIVMIWKFNYRPQLVIKKSIINKVWRYSAINYLSGILNMLPLTILPILITNHLGAESAAFFYIVMMIGNLLYIIPRATTNSMFAESSNNELALDANVKKSIKIITVLLAPSVLVLLIGGGTILRIFGKDYSAGGTAFLTLVTLSSIALSGNNIYGSLFQVQKNLRAIIIMNIVSSLLTIILSFVLLRFGLVGIGFAMLTGYLGSFLVGHAMFRISMKQA